MRALPMKPAPPVTRILLWVVSKKFMAFQEGETVRPRTAYAHLPAR